MAGIQDRKQNANIRIESFEFDMKMTRTKTAMRGNAACEMITFIVIFHSLLRVSAENELE